MKATVIVLLTVVASNAVADTSRRDPGAEDHAARLPVTASVDTVSHDAGTVMLDEITIEGEIDVPRVLFISARDHLRTVEPLTALYLIDPIDLGRRAPELGRLTPPSVTLRPEDEQVQQER